MVAPRQLAPAVAQREQRVELLDELRRRGLPAQRPDRDAVAGGRLARDLEDRERDVEPAAQVDVAVGRLLELLVARRLERLDQPVLEHERSELGVRGLVVHVLGIARPLPRRREVRARARPQADRLADVQRAPVGVAEDVDARVLRQPRHVGAAVDAARRLRLGLGSRAARFGRSSASASPIVPACAHSFGNSAQNTRAHVSASGSARCTAATSIPSASASAASPRRRCSGASRRASATVHSTGGSGQSSPARSNACCSTRGVEARVVGDEHAPLQLLGERRQHRARAAARRRPSPARCR